MMLPFPTGLRVRVRGTDRWGVVRAREGIDQMVVLDEPYNGLRVYLVDQFDLLPKELPVVAHHVLAALQGQWEDDGWIKRRWMAEVAGIDAADELDVINEAIRQLRDAGYVIEVKREAAGDLYRLVPQAS